MKTNANYNFIGNAEPIEIFKSEADVIVCDGFVGNMLMKHTEAFARVIAKRGLVDEYIARFNYEIYGGLPLLGANGVVVIGHGISNERAIKSMVLQSKTIYQSDITAKLKEALTDKN
jgi:glycerol-3-phosphate acyltransferase PlsX